MYPILFLAAGLTALTFLATSGLRGPGPGTRDSGLGTRDSEEPPTDPAEVVKAIQDELVSQSLPEGRDRLGKLLREQMTIQLDADTWQLAFPVDLEGTLTFRRMTEICRTLSEAYRTPVTIQKIQIRKVPFALVTVGPYTETAADVSWVERMGRHPSVTRRGRSTVEYGGIFDLIVNTVVASAVGTVVSIGTQDVMRSLGGPRRLARLQRHYNKAEAAGDQQTMDRIREKIRRSAVRIKGKEVDWARVEEVTGIPM